MNRSFPAATNLESDSARGIDTLAASLIGWFNTAAVSQLPSHELDQEDPTNFKFVVALSGGVDSAVVAKAAGLSGEDCVLVTAQSPSVAQRELSDAHSLAEQIGLPHRLVKTQELADPDYQQNSVRRCYYCKSQLFKCIVEHFSGALILTGTNADDLGDYRPGLDAAREASVRAPLAELNITKAEVREIAQLWQLTVAEKPASPCLASRIAYGVEVTPQRLAMIEAAEVILRELGLLDCRVRLHDQDLARVEVPSADIEKIVAESTRTQLAEKFKELGFRFVTLDLEGFRSGSLNAVVQLSVDGSSHPE